MRVPTTGGTTVDTDEEIPCITAEADAKQVDLVSDDDVDQAVADAILTAEAVTSINDLLTPITREELLRYKQDDPF